MRNITTGTVYVGDGSNLKTALEEADASGTVDLLRIEGICKGHFSIAKPLKLRGVATGAFPTPSLDGNSTGIVLTVALNEEVSLRSLTITHGRTARAGAGILNHGLLTLEGTTTVTGNEAVAGGTYGNGGGIANYGYGLNHRAFLTLSDSSAVESNTAYRNGGGIANRYGTVTLTESSAVRNNVAYRNGGGIANRGSIEKRFYRIYTGLVLLRDSSVVQSNVAHGNGGGIANRGAVGMSEAAQVTANQAGSTDAPSFGGGIFNTRLVSLHRHEPDPFYPSITGNSAPGGSGGGVYNVPPSGYVLNCTYAPAILSPNTPDDPPEPEEGCD